MEKYTTYKPSGIKWIGEIPEHWDVHKIRYLFQEKSQKGYPNEPILSATQKYGVIPQDLYENRVVVVNKGLEGLKLVEEGDFVISLRSFQGGIEYAYYRGIISAAYTILKPSINLNSDYIKYVFKSHTFIELLKTCVTGIREGQNINYELLRNKYLFIPPLSEQHTIVAFLEKATANIDAYIKQTEQEINTLNELKQAEIAQVVTKGLNPNAPMKDSGISWIGEIPEHWECKRIGSTYIENKHINSDLGCNEAYKFNYGSLVRKDEDVKLEEVADVYSKYTVISKNDIIINGLNLNYDFVTQRVAIVEQKGIITSAYVAITPREDVNSEYFSYLFKSMDAKKLFNGMGTGIRLTLGFGELKKQQIPIPPKDEQDLIVKNIKAKTSKIEEYITALKSEIAQMQEYKQRLISDVVTGKMDVRNFGR